MHCPNCGQEIIEGSEFCCNCGARIEEHHPVGLTCAKCGSQNLPGAEFCAECGARLGGETVSLQAFCPECGAAVKQNATFCPECGAALAVTEAPIPSVCPGCGEPLALDAVFCGNCGWAVGQGAGYAPSAPKYAATDSSQSYQEQSWEHAQIQQQQEWAPQQPQSIDYSQQQDWVQPQPQPQQQNWEPQPQVNTQPKGSRKMLMAAAAVVILLVIGITGFWKPGFLLDLFRPTAKLENGTLALNDITLDFKQTNLADGAATLTTVRDEEEEQNGLIGDLYVMNVDKNCQGKVTVSIPIPKDFKPTTGNGLYIKFVVRRDYTLADGKTSRIYSYFNTEVKDGKVVAIIDPAALGKSLHKFKTSAKPAESKKGMMTYTEYSGFFYKEGLLKIGEGYKYSKGHFRLWYDYNMKEQKNVYMKTGEAQKLLTDLEEAYNYYKTHGYADHVDTFTPIDVYITRSKEKGDKAREGGWDTLTGNIELNEAMIFGPKFNQAYEGEDRQRVKSTIYHEVFHAVQQSIVNMFNSKIMGTLWFDEATATHFEKLPRGISVTDNEQKNYWRLWQGPIPKENSAEEGYARGLLIDFISKKVGGDHWIRECYENWSADYLVDWSTDYDWLKGYMKLIAPTEADFAAKFYLEIVNGFGIQSAAGYYLTCLNPIEDEGHDHYLSALRLELDDKTKEKIAKGKEDVFPIVFTGPSFELAGYGGRVVALVTTDKVKGKSVNLAESLPDKCQLKLEAEGSRIQLIQFKDGANLVLSGNVIKNLKEQLNKGYRYLVLVTSTQSKKQNVVLKATLTQEELKEGIYNGKTTMTQGKKSQTVNNKVGFRLTQGKDGRWGLNICQANGDNMGSAPNVPLTYDAKQKIWKGHRKFKEELSKDPKKSKAEVSTINCTMKVNTEGKEPALIIDYKVNVTKLYIDYYFSGDASFKVHFEGRWSSELKGKTLKTGKITILE